jgi:hypothetical protein
MTAPITTSTSVERLAALVCATLDRHGIEAVLTGGAVVSIYSRNEYRSYDLDFVVRGLAKDVRAAMASLGFAKRAGRHFEHPRTPYYVEFPSGPLAIGNEPVSRTAVRRTAAGVLRLLTPTDCVMDRLAAFYHWNDVQGLEQAVAVAKRQRIESARVRSWSRREGMEVKFAVFERRVRSLRNA